MPQFITVAGISVCWKSIGCPVACHCRTTYFYPMSKNAAVSRLVEGPFSESSVIEAARSALEEIGGKVSFGIVFASADYRAHLTDFAELLQLHGHIPLLAGCSASAIAGPGRELEGGQGFSLALFYLPKTSIRHFTFNEEQSDNTTDSSDWHRISGAAPDDIDAWLFLGDPRRVAPDPWLANWNAAYPGIPTIGGLASGGVRGDDIFLFCNRKEVEAGVAIGLKGGVKIRTVVSQGCRPIGEPHAITGAAKNVITAIGSRPAYEVLNDSFLSMTPAEKARAAGNIFAGLAVNEYVDNFKTGDFLIRHLLAADPESGDVVVAAFPRVGQTLQFQLRDKNSADEELDRLLAKVARRKRNRPFACLLFACGGRGESLFDAQHHDAAAIERHLGPIPLAGLFCNGEIGPVGDRNHVHGYTAAIALFE